MKPTPVNICFIANFYKTYLFDVLAQSLIKQGVGVYWIVTKLDQYKFLSEHYSKEHVLYINRSFVDTHEETIGDFRINELVYGDRVFKHDLKNGLLFLKNIQQPLYNFIKQNSIRFVFGEITWAHELLLQRIIEQKTELSCLYLECSVVRIPNRRLAFFNDECQYKMLEFNEAVIFDEIIKLEKPAYLKLNDTILKKNSSIKGRLGRIKRFISGENIEKNDPNVITNTPTRFKVASLEEYNKLSYKRIETISFDEIKQHNYVFFGFHKQPEASIDVSGRYYEDQALNVINLWRLLPPGWKIVVKEHSNAIGDRSFKFYKKLLAFPNIVMVDEKTDSKQLIEMSQLVATVTGTIAYEAALMKVPAITFSKVFFNRINYCRYVPLHQLVNYKSLIDLVQEIKQQPDNRLEFSRFLLKNTFNGYMSDHVTDPSVLEPENISQLTYAFMKVIQTHGSKE